MDKFYMNFHSSFCMNFRWSNFNICFFVQKKKVFSTFKCITLENISCKFVIMLFKLLKFILFYYIYCYTIFSYVFFLFMWSNIFFI